MKRKNRAAASACLLATLIALGSCGENSPKNGGNSAKTGGGNKKNRGTPGNQGSAIA